MSGVHTPYGSVSVRCVYVSSHALRDIFGCFFSVTPHITELAVVHTRGSIWPEIYREADNEVCVCVCACVNKNTQNNFI